MRIGTVVAGLVGSVAIGVVFWLALFGFVHLNRPVPNVVGPGVVVAPGAGVPGAPVAVPAPARSQGQASASAAGPGQIKVVATDLQFDQKEIGVAAGQPVETTLKNEGVLEHDIVVKELNLHVYAQGGQTAKGSFTPDKEGTYEFFCSIPGHREAGMVGKLIVIVGR